jgi:hypothetical protein
LVTYRHFLRQVSEKTERVMEALRIICTRAKCTNVTNVRVKKEAGKEKVAAQSGR